MSSQQQSWIQPMRREAEPVLKVYNSLTKTKTDFIPKNGRHVTWYNCGPTVYDSSHMGHARNYVTQDILRRIINDYFGYEVHFVMNITDIDDKIIQRSRENHVLKLFREQVHHLTPELVGEVEDAWRIYFVTILAKCLPEGERPTEGSESETWSRVLERVRDTDWKSACMKREEKFDMQFKALLSAENAIKTAKQLLVAGTTTNEAANKLIDDSQDILLKVLDKKFGDTVTDPALSRALAQHWEAEFFKDMTRLKVRPPDTLTRVTEYVPEIVAYVERIIENGYAYEAKGNVYFDTENFDGHDGHTYAKLQPGSKGHSEFGEGTASLAVGQRSKGDFALWKASKLGEPSWPSPWGPGRPGWHIECSVMASAVLGDNMDIHSGGIDLAFPHHDNELAQSEAFHNCEQWVNYFLHTGHLHIDGLKMSKSLKNFITINEILQKYTARQMRLSFLTQLWNSKVDFTDSLMTGEVRTIETTLNNFFTNVKAILFAHVDKVADGQHRYGQQERELQEALHASQSAFRAALCDSFNTPLALEVLLKLVSRTNIYITERGKDVNIGVVERIARWIGKMLRMFGLGEGDGNKTEFEIGWGEERREGVTNRDEVVMPYLKALSSFRDEIRRLAITNDGGAVKGILRVCDRLRDEDLIPLGVALDDQEDGRALVKLVDPEQLIRIRQEKSAAADARVAKKAAAVEAEQAKRMQKIEKGRTTPSAMFKPPNVPEGTYGTWDDAGIPLTDGEGKALSKNAAKKIHKDHAVQQKLHEEFLQWQASQGV